MAENQADDCQKCGGGVNPVSYTHLYPEGEYDLAGFTVGLVGREKSISGERVAEGDVLVGMASSGVHSNGYSLVRKLVPVSYTHLIMHLTLEKGRGYVSAANNKNPNTPIGVIPTAGSYTHLRQHD